MRPEEVIKVNQEQEVKVLRAQYQAGQLDPPTLARELQRIRDSTAPGMPAHAQARRLLDTLAGMP